MTWRFILLLGTTSFLSSLALVALYFLGCFTEEDEETQTLLGLSVGVLMVVSIAYFKCAKDVREKEKEKENYDVFGLAVEQMS